MTQALTMQNLPQILTNKLEDVKSKLKEHDVQVAAGIVAATISTLVITVLTGGLGLIVAAGVLGGVVLASGGSVAANRLSESEEAEPKATLSHRTLKPVQPPQPMLAITYEGSEQEEIQDAAKAALPQTDAIDHCDPALMQSLFLRSVEPKQPHNPDPLVNCDAMTMQSLFGAPTVHPSFKDIVNGQHKNVQEAPVREGLGKSTRELRREAMLARQEAKLDCLSGCDSKTMQDLFGSAHASYRDVLAKNL